MTRGYWVHDPWWIAEDPEGVTWGLTLNKIPNEATYLLARIRHGNVACIDMKCRGTIQSDNLLEDMLKVMLDHYQVQSVVVLLFLRDWITQCYLE
jgi:hypothetical protein